MNREIDRRDVNFPGDTTGSTTIEIRAKTTGPTTLWWKMLVVRCARMRTASSKRRPRFDGGATTVLVDSIRHAARPLSPRHFCRCLPPPTTPQNPPGLHRTRCKRSPAYNRRRRSRRCLCHPPPTRHRSLRYRLAQLSLVRTRHSHSDIRTVALSSYLRFLIFVSFSLYLFLA